MEGAVNIPHIGSVQALWGVFDLNLHTDLNLNTALEVQN